MTKSNELRKGMTIIPIGMAWPTGALRVQTVETDSVKVYPEGGGLQMTLRLDQLRVYRTVPTTEMQNKKLEAGMFEMEGLDGTFPGWANGVRWNGWEKPWFDNETAQRITEAMGGRYNNATDSFEGWNGVEWEMWSGQTVGTDQGEKHLYPVGNGSWIWEKKVTDHVGADKEDGPTSGRL